jgi:hypothetical protein
VGQVDSTVERNAAQLKKKKGSTAGRIACFNYILSSSVTMSVNVYAHEIFFYVLLAGLRDGH